MTPPTVTGPIVTGPAVSRPGPGARVLLIEDDPGDALLVQQCLLEAGLDPDYVSWVRTLAEGIALLAGGSYCVLLDLGLPDASGVSALVELANAAPSAPVIVLTGRHDQTALAALAAGAQDYLVKDGINSDLLDRSIRYAIERKRAQDTRLQLRQAQFTAAENARRERGLLPTPLLYANRVRCSTYYQPGSDHAVLGGDFFDVVELADGTVRAVIGDVMGHGPDEAAIGVYLRVAWRTLVLAGTPPVQILPTLARLLAAETRGAGEARGGAGRVTGTRGAAEATDAFSAAGFVTVCDVTLTRDGTGHARVAGHPAPLLCMATGARYLEVEVGPPLGVQIPDWARARWQATGGWPDSEFTFADASSLILYTDGLLDSYARPEDLGLSELVVAVDACARTGDAPSTWIPALVAGAPNRALDDTAVVVITAHRGPK